jgi:hypothetical protein
MGPRTEQWINRPVALSGSAMVAKPLGLLAELTHRCPLGCPYCSNPLALDAREDELDNLADEPPHENATPSRGVRCAVTNFGRTSYGEDLNSPGSRQWR